MKKLLMLFALFTTLASNCFGWNPTVRVKNNTPCTFMARFYMTVAMEPPYGCTYVFSTQIIVLPYADVLYGANQLAQTGDIAGPRNFVGGSVSDGMPGCLAGVYPVDGGCFSYMPSTRVVPMQYGDGITPCTLCKNAVVTWTDTPGGTPSSTLTID